MWMTAAKLLMVKTKQQQKKPFYFALEYCKLQYFGHLKRRVDSMEKTLMLGGIGGRRRRGRPRMRWLDGITDSIGRESE